MVETKKTLRREAVTGGIFECRYDKSLTLTQADNSLFRLLGMNAGSLKSGTPISFLDRICAEDRPIFLEKIRYQLSRSRVFMSELHIVTSEGQLRWIHVCGELLNAEQEIPCLHCIFHDVTDARDRQERLAIESQIYDIILSQTQDIIFELDCLTRDIYYSPTFEKKSVTRFQSRDSLTLCLPLTSSMRRTRYFFDAVFSPSWQARTRCSANTV